MQRFLLPILSLALLAGSGCADQEALKQEAVAACEGRLNFGYGDLDRTVAAKCDSMLEAMAEVLAVIEAERGDGSICVSRSFDVAAYKQGFLEFLGHPDTRLDELSWYFIGEFSGKAPGRKDCGWMPVTTTRSLEKNCRWLQMLSSDAESVFEGIAKEFGLPANQETYTFGTESIMRCEGYYKGAVMAAEFASNVYQTSIYCRLGGSETALAIMEDVSFKRLEQMVLLLPEEAGSSEGMAAEHVHEVLKVEFPCPRADR